MTAKNIRVFSTSSTDISYVEYRDGPAGGVPSIVRSVTIKGGAHVASKHLVTPRGVMTLVDADELDFLTANEQFKAHLKAGFVRFESRNVELADVVADMNDKDLSRPLTEADYRKGGRAYAGGINGPMKAPASHAS